jgi:hypothetical protein
LERQARACSNFDAMRLSAAGIACLGCAALAGVAVPGAAFGQDTAAPAEAAPPAPAPRKSAQSRPSKTAGRAKQPGNAGSVVPGFETLADGSTRLFVELSQPVKYEAKPAAAVFTCVLKGAHVDRRNNYNPLVTVDFNTPVTSARLVPHGADLWLVAVLRAKVSPTVTMDATKEGGAMLRIEFPKGDYVRTIPPAPESSSASPGGAEATPDDTDAPPSTH